MSTVTSTTTKCQAKNPAFCRFHGDSKRLTFEKNLRDQLARAKKQVEEAGNNIDKYLEAKEFLEEAEIEYAATLDGEEQLRELIKNTSWPESEVLEERLKAALALREEWENDDSELGSYAFPASKLEDAISRIEKANRKLERAGVEDRFTYEVEEYIEEDEEGHQFSMVKLQLSHPKLNIQGWDFVAAVDKSVDGDILTRVLPGQELGGVRPDSQYCEHCGSRRSRKTTYLLRNGDGELKQVGSNCLSSFLGVEPKGLWALSYDFNQEGTRLNSGGRVYGGPDTVLNLQETVAMALAVSHGGDNYVSSARARESFTSSTADQVRYQFFNPTIKNEDRVDPSPYMDKAKELIENTKFEGDTDYATNMRTITSREHVGIRQMSMAVSVIAAANRSRWQAEREAARAAHVPSVGFIADKGEKIKNINLKVKKVFHDHNDYGPTTFLIMESEDGKEVIWRASKELNYSSGDTINVLSATVKDHSNYNGNDQTVLTRARVFED